MSSGLVTTSYMANTAVKFVFDPTVAPVQEPAMFLNAYTMMCLLYNHSANASKECTTNLFPDMMANKTPWSVLMTLFGGLIHSWYSKEDASSSTYKAWLPLVAAYPTLMMTSRLSLVSEQHMICRRILTRGGYDTPCNCNSRR